MKRVLSLGVALSSFCLFFSLTAHSQTKAWELAKSRVLSMGIDLEQHPDAAKELKDHIEACGLGIVTGWSGGNQCSYQIKLDNWFFKPLQEKTGLLHDPNWAYRPGVEFITASAKEMEEVPEAWDLSEVGPMTDIHRQQCGDCWSTSSRKLLEQAMATHGDLTEEGELFQLSAQTTLSSCCRWCGSCNGGYMSTPNFFSREGESAYGYGLPTRDLDPYRGANTSCRFNQGELEGFAQKLIRAPYIGSSLQYSRFFGPDNSNGPKVENTMANMIKYKSNALVTIQAISQSGGIITSCSSINAPGNHMQNIVGWYQHNGETIARIQNSWGTDHGQDGYTHLKWECGEGRLNRGLGKSTRVGIYKLEESCPYLATAYTGPDKVYRQDLNTKGVVIGQQGTKPQTCRWLPAEGIEEVLSADGCQVRVNPEVATEYHVFAKDVVCGTELSSMVLVVPTNDKGQPLAGGSLRTPHGMTKL